MTHDPRLVELLCRPENVTHALLIGDAAEAVRSTLQERLWAEAAEAISAEASKASWTVRVCDDQLVAAPAELGIDLDREDVLFAGIGAQHHVGRRVSQIVCGIYWSSAKLAPAAMDLPQAVALSRAAEADFGQSSDWWLAYRLYSSDRSNGFSYVDIANGDLPRWMASKMLELMRAHRKALVELNLAIVAKRPRKRP
jgi:hypothetical protein